MGQYYVIATREENSQEIQFIDPDGVKMLEHAWLGATTTQDIFSHLLSRPMTVAWVGDYACRAGEYDEISGKWRSYPQPIHTPTRPALFAGAEGEKRAEFVLAAYKSWWGADYDARKGKAVKFSHNPEDEFDPANFVIVNDTKKLFIDCKHQIALYTKTEKYGEAEYKHCINPLAILCDASQEDAGGDYHGANMWASGIWCGDIIRVEKRDEFLAGVRDTDFEEFSVPFTDSMRIMRDNSLDNLKG